MDLKEYVLKNKKNKLTTKKSINDVYIKLLEAVSDLDSILYQQIENNICLLYSVIFS